MRKWQLGIALILSAIGLAVGTPHTVEATLVPGTQDNLDPNLKNMRVIPGKENADPNAPTSEYTSNQGILARTGVLPSDKSGNPISNTNSGDQTVGSPIDIQIGNTSTSGDPAQPWFVMNYVDAPKGMNYLNFSNPYSAINLSSNTGLGNVTPKMNLDEQGRDINNPVLKRGKNYDGGFLNVSGNVPIHAIIRDDADSTDALMQGNWGVMVKVTLPQDVDTMSIANAIAWDQAYFYLAITIKAIDFKVNFPLQFDHHVYKDPDDAKSFYLKVKGIPYMIYNDIVGADNRAWFYPRKDVDAPDMLRNLSVANGTASQLVQLGGETLPDKRWKDYSTYNHSIFPMWGAAGPVISPNPSNQFSSATGLFNSLNPGGGRTQTGLMWFVQFARQILTGSGFDGNANINFNIDISKYNGGTTKQYQPLTRSRLFPSPRADGKFNDTTVNSSNVISNQDSSKNTVKMAMYPSSSLVDPRPNAATNYNYKMVSNEPSNMQLKENTAGTTPMDFAIVDPSKPKVEFPVIVNASSWNSFVVPYDNRAIGTSTDPTTYYKTILPQTEDIPSITDKTSQVGSTILNRTAQPDFFEDGLFVNTEQQYAGANPYQNTSDGAEIPKLDTSPNPENGFLGAVTPKRYTRAYKYFDFTSTALGTEVKPTEITNGDPTGGGKVTFQAVEKTKTQIDAGPTSVVIPIQPTPPQAPVGGGPLSKVLGNPSSDVWQLTGTYGNVPMLPAPLKLDQQRESRIGSSQANNLSIKQTDIADGKTYPETYEKVWGDPMASKSMPDKLYLITNGGAKVDLNYTINNPVPLETGDITFNFTSGTGAPNANGSAGSKLVINVPVGTNDTYNTYDLVIQPSNFNIATTDGTKAYWSAAPGDSSADHFLLNLFIANDITKTVQLTNYFYDNEVDPKPDWSGMTSRASQHFIDSQANSVVNVTGKYQNTGNVAMKDLDLLIPTPTGISLTPESLTVRNSDGTQPAGNPVFTKSTDAPSGYTRYRYSGANLAAGASIYYSYTMTVAGSSLAADPTQLISRAVSGPTTALKLLGDSTPTLSLVKSTGVHLLSVPDFNFAESWHNGVGTNYKLGSSTPTSDVTFTTDPSKTTDFLFQYVDGNPQTNDSKGKPVDIPGANPGWSMTGTLSNFKSENPKQADPQTEFTINLGRGEPMKPNGTYIMPDSYLTDNGRLDTNIKVGESNKYSSEPDSLVNAEHTANMMTSNNSSSVLYVSDKLFENRYLKPSENSRFLIRYDLTKRTSNDATADADPVKLKVPSTAFNKDAQNPKANIHPGTYTASVSYTIINGLQ
ncbi:hypothetical protein [Lacticaseibacillus saniviri]|uniref:hypothetical protein n=1 Tax=Lacticaseibacillus saniviri TaxID=931533 RepID=UPI0006D0F3BD|nr:hypothetical protein [Lacticaseibacillus saniviri]